MMNFCFHLVSLSPWPLMSSMSIMFILTSSIKLIYTNNYYFFFLSLILMFLNLFQWWRDIIRESFLQGMHTNFVENNLKLGMIMFIISEIMFFSSFFWTYFHFMLSPNFEIGNMFPSFYLEKMNPLSIPLMNTLILLSSSISITTSHHYLLVNNFKKSLKLLKLTFILGLIFLMCQIIEYYNCSFNLSDSCYGSIFFLTTGFHGFHVLIGTMFIIIIFFRMKSKNLSKFHHFGFEAASWYWHFVDVIWLFLYTFMYYLIY